MTAVATAAPPEPLDMEPPAVEFPGSNGALSCGDVDDDEVTAALMDNDDADGTVEDLAAPTCQEEQLQKGKEAPTGRA